MDYDTVSGPELGHGLRTISINLLCRDVAAEVAFLTAVFGMTAKVGFPTLRLIRWAVGDWTLDGLAPGEWRELEISGQPDRKRRVIARNASKYRGVD